MVDSAARFGCFEAQLPPELESVVAARRLVGAAVRAWDLPEPVGSDGALTVSELVANSVLHAGTPVSLEVRRLGQGMRIEVGDGSPRLPVVDAERPEDLLANRSMTGRGLKLVAAMSDRWGADPVGNSGKVTWAEIGTGQRLVSSGPQPEVRSETAPYGLDEAATTDATAVTAGGHRIRMTGIPVRLLMESIRHFADLEREMQVMSLAHRGPDDLDDVIAESDQIRHVLDPWTAVERRLADAAVARGEDRIDHDFVVPEDLAETMERLATWLYRVGESEVSRTLLTEPPTPRVQAYRKWYCDEIISQLSGSDPRPCPLPADDGINVGASV